MDPILFLWIFLLLVGFALLVKGADFFVDGAAGISGKCRISPLVIGLTVVAFGTSAPELCVSIASAIRGSSQISVGNVVGSNIVNILLILGLSALIRSLPVQKNSVELDLPVLLVSSVLLIVLGLWGQALEWWDGLIMLAVFAVYMFLLFRRAFAERKRAPAEDKPLPVPEKRGKLRTWYGEMLQRTWFLVLLTAAGLAMVAGGGALLVRNAEQIAAYFSVSQRVIGLTVVAIGTSLPELVTSVVAAKKGETDIAVGNILGSNIFNILLVAGTAALIRPLPFAAETNLVDALVALAAALLLCIAALGGGRKLGRAAGISMLVFFAAYYVALFTVI